jgi:CelD/BcsL family acetyltransferase involved in cellulose biosynthesis
MQLATLDEPLVFLPRAKLPVEQSPSMDDHLKVRCFPGKQLPAELCAQWDALQRVNSTLASPFFRPEFTQTVAAVRDDVEVAFVEDTDRVVAVFPYQRASFGAARPVAGRLSDFQGLISASDWQCDPKRLLQRCGLRSWHFDHLLATQTSFEPYMWTKGVSPFIDLAAGFDAYERDRKAQNSEIPTIKRKLKKMEREVGPLRLEWNCANRDHLQTLMRWKGDHYRRSGFRDLFSFPWITQFFDRLLALQTPELSGTFTCLYAGDRLAAAHLGMSSRHVLHWWFPSYDRELGKYSPGLALIYLMAQQAHEYGISRLDFGKGDEEYKFRLASGAEQVCEGSVDLQFSRRLIQRTWQTTRDWVKNSPLDGPTQAPLRWLRWMRDWLSFQ